MDNNRITQFQGQYRWLSNFYQTPIEIRGVTFPSVEAAFQATKAIDGCLDSIFCGLSPGQSKILGKNIRMRDDWDEIKFEVMETLLRIKFQDRELRERLINTGDAELFEGNAHGDILWGCDWETLQGQNKLGKLLMKLRAEYQAKANANSIN